MGRTHERVSTLEAASAKNMADVAATMAALAGNEASHNRTAEAVAGISATVTGTVDDLVGRHIGALKSDVSSLGQDVHALCTLLATMHGKPPPPAAPPDGAPAAGGTTPHHKVNFIHADANAMPPPVPCRQG